MNLVFMGTPQFAVPTLEALLDAGHRVSAVLCQPDRPAGRRRRVAFGPVKRLAVDRGIPVHQPRRLRKNPEIVEMLRALAADTVVVAAYGLILPPRVLEIPRLGCVNLHGSLLPRHRGASPVQHTILCGDPETGVTTMLMDRGMDTGPILLAERMPVSPRETAASLSERLAAAGAPLVVKTLALMAEGRIEPAPQAEAEATYAPLLRKEDGIISWEHRADEIDRQVRGLVPWPTAHTWCGGRMIRILEARPVTPAAEGGGGAAPGTIIGRHGNGFLVACGGGTVLQVLTAQPENRKAMDGLCCLNGRVVCPNDRFHGPDTDGDGSGRPRPNAPGASGGGGAAR